MELINNVINNLEKIKGKSSLKVFLEEYKKMYEQLSKEREYRIRLIEELKNKLLEIRKNNLEVEQSDDFKQLKRIYRKEYIKTRDISLYYIAMCGYSQEEAHKKQEEERNRINNKFAEELDKLGYINKEIVCGHEYEIDNYVENLYRKYVCEEFGHEYVRYDNGKVEVVMEGHEGPEYAFDVFERCTGLASAGSPGTPMVICKYCGEKIYKENILNPDFKDKQKILLPLSELDNECK